MRLPSPTLSADERAVLASIAEHGQRRCLGVDPATGTEVEIAEMLATELRRRLRLTTMRLARLAWALQDPRRFRADLLFVDERHVPAVVRLTPEGMSAAAGDVPVEPKLARAISDGVKPAADPDAVDQLLFR